MAALAHALQYLVAAGFIAAAVVAYRDWLIWHGRGRGYLAAAVILLAVVSLLGLVTVTLTGLLMRLATDSEVAAFLGVGYFLLLYRHELVAVHRFWLRAMAGLCLVALCVTAVVVTLPVKGAVTQLLDGALVLAAWAGCVAESIWRLWAVSTSRPVLQRARLRAVALAYAGIAVITTVETLAFAASSTPGLQLVLALFSLMLVPVLFVAFAPPAWLRYVWRQREEQAYGAVMRDLLGVASDREALAGRSLEWAIRLVGGGGGIMVGPDGALLARQDVDQAQAESLRSALLESAERVAVSPLDPTRRAILLPARTDRGTGGLAVVSGTFSPVFGKDEMARLQHHVAASTAALERATLEQSLRRREEEVRVLNKELERRVRIRTEQLEASNHELEAFSYTVSHDLRAPLRAVDGFARILLEEYEADLPEEGKRYLRLVGSNAEDMGKLIDALLTFSRMSRAPLRRQEVSPSQVARDSVRVLEAGLSGRQVEFRVEEMPRVQSDPVLLQEVFSNLIGNAIKFSRDRPQALVEVGSSPAEGDGPPVFYVRDNGVGFDMRYVDKIFGVFQRLHRSQDFEGTGAGLAIVQRIINRHGGKVWADAIPGQGATFYFTVGEASGDE
ncbi:MAG: ATP-binding protein [Candidatus Dormibacteria bacterium]